jgi:hypothetical protein
MEWEEGIYKKGTGFEGNRYSYAYRRHLEAIEGIKEESKAAYEAIMAKILEQVTCVSLSPFVQRPSFETHSNTSMHSSKHQASSSSNTTRRKFDLTSYEQA